MTEPWGHTRRSFIKAGAGVPLGALAGGLPWLVSSVQAEPIATINAVMAVVNGALAAAKLLGTSGPSVTDLMNLQMAVLQKISSQLGVVQQGIELILARINDIEQQLDKMPKAVVRELYEQRLRGVLRLYDETMRTYESDVRSLGLGCAQRKAKPRLETEVLGPLREIHSVLFSYPASIAPILAAGLHTEVHAMIMAGYGTSVYISDFRSALGAYGKWFNDSTVSIDGQMLDLRKERSDRLKELNEMQRQDSCLVDGHPRPECPNGVHLEVRFGLHGFQTSEVVLEKSLKEASTQLLEEHVLLPEDIPVGAMIRPGLERVPMIVDTCTGVTSTRTDLIPADAELIKDHAKRLYQRPCSKKDIDFEMLPRAGAIGTILTNSGYTLLSLAALKSCCATANNAISKFQRQLDTA